MSIKAGDIENIRKEHGVSVFEAVSHLKNKELKRELEAAIAGKDLNVIFPVLLKCTEHLIDKCYPTLRGVK